MKRPLQLETFVTGAPAAEPADLTEARQTGYEAGHRDGWQACEDSLRSAEARTREALGVHLQTLAFSYQEARDHVLRGLEPLLQDIVAKLLPKLAHQMLLPRILEHLLPTAAMGTVKPTIQVAPTHLKDAQDFLSRTAGVPFAVQARADLGPGQAILTLGEQEQKIDLDGANQAIAAAITEFFQTNWPDPAPNTDVHHD